MDESVVDRDRLLAPDGVASDHYPDRRVVCLDELPNGSGHVIDRWPICRSNGNWRATDLEHVVDFTVPATSEPHVRVNGCSLGGVDAVGEPHCVVERGHAGERGLTAEVVEHAAGATIS